MYDLFDYTNRIWKDGNNLFHVNGCAYCGLLESGHGWYTFCKMHEGSNGRYTAPNDATRLARMKSNRANRNK
jgi:hypothetical protein